MKKKAAKKKPKKEIILKTSATFEEMLQISATSSIKKKK